MGTIVSIIIGAAIISVAGLIGGAIQFFYDSLMESQFTSLADITKFIPGLFGISSESFLKTIVLFSIALCVTVTVINVVKAIMAPALGKESESPSTILWRMIAAIIMILLYRLFWDTLAYNLNNFISDTRFFGSEIPKGTLFSSWTIGSVFDANVLVNFVFYIAILAGFIGAGITHIERYLSFALFMAFGPICIAFYPGSSSKSVTSEWFKGVLAQSFGILLSYFTLGMVGHAMTGVLGPDGKLFSEIVRFAVTLTLLSFCKNSEQFLNALGLRTMPSGDTFRQFASGMGLAAMTVKGGTGMIKGTAKGFNSAIDFKNKFKMDGGFGGSFANTTAKTSQLLKTGNADFVKNAADAKNFGKKYANHLYKTDGFNKTNGFKINDSKSIDDSLNAMESKFKTDARKMLFGDDKYANFMSKFKSSDQSKIIEDQWQDFKSTAKDSLTNMNDVKSGKYNVVSAESMNSALGMNLENSNKKCVSNATKVKLPVITRGEGDNKSINVAATHDLWNSGIEPTAENKSELGSKSFVDGYLVQTETKGFDGTATRNTEFVLANGESPNFNRQVGTMLSENYDFGARMDLDVKTSEGTTFPDDIKNQLNSEDNRHFDDVRFQNKVNEIGDIGAYSIPLQTVKSNDYDNKTNRGVTLSNTTWRMDPRGEGSVGETLTDVGSAPINILGNNQPSQNFESGKTIMPLTNENLGVSKEKVEEVKRNFRRSQENSEVRIHQEDDKKQEKLKQQSKKETINRW